MKNELSLGEASTRKHQILMVHFTTLTESLHESDGYHTLIILTLLEFE